MIDELKQLLTVIGNAPDMALNAFMLFGIYKLFVFLSTTAGIYGVIRLGINKYHDLKTKEIDASKLPREVIYNLKDSNNYLSEEAIQILENILRGIKPNDSGWRKTIYKQDLEFIMTALREENLKKGEKQ